MLVGYARVSSAEQSLDLQRDALKGAGVGRVFTDHASGRQDDRPGLAAALAALQAGDVLVVWKLDRLGRSLRHLVETVSALERRGIGLRVLSGGIDTTSAAGRLVFGIFAALAEFEAELIRERTLAGLAAAKARGRKGGRPRVLTTKQLHHARLLIEEERASIKDVAATLGVARSTLYRALAADTVERPPGAGEDLRHGFATRKPAEIGRVAV
jgi:DNA invertase Pin-like site-specific DNA recombinase